MRQAAIVYGAVLAVAGSALAIPSVGVARPAGDARTAAGCAGDAPRTVSLRPRSGPTGTRVRIRGRCFDRRWNYGYGVFFSRQFTRPRECELLAGGRQRFRVADDGTARGFIIVPRRGHCFQRDYERAVTPGRYDLGIGCHACHIGSFRVTRR